jgi:hypothetical protein
MFLFIAWFSVPPMLIEFCILRCGAKNVLLSILISAFLNSLLWLGLYVACNWGIRVIPESSQTPHELIDGKMIFYSVLLVLATGASLVPAGLCGFVYSKWKRARRESTP